MKLWLSILCAVLLTTSSAFALSRDKCHKASRRFVVSLLLGNHDDLGPVDVEKPGGWSEWLATSFPGPGEFVSFSIVTKDPIRGGCVSGIRIRKSEGNVYALFATFDNDGHLTQLLTLWESLEIRRRQLTETLEDIDKVMPDLRSGQKDDRALLPLLNRLSKTARRAREDISKYIDTLTPPDL